MHEDTAPSQATCPFLGTLEMDDTVGPHLEYPSFENRCLASENGDAILLTDQATYCLCSGYPYCPRYRAAAPRLQAAAAGAAEHATLQSDQIAASLFALQHEMDDDAVERRSQRRQFTWMAAGMAFVSIFLCGSLFAIYTGWQLINQNLAAQQLGQLDTLAAGSTPTPPQVYIVMTATSPPTATPQAVAQAPDTAAGSDALPPATFVFPAAVTATPLAGDGQVFAAPLSSSATVPDEGGVPVVVVAPNAVTGQGEDLADDGALQTPPAELQLQVPTRRPTPVFDVPTSTPMPAEPTPTATWTPTPLGTPVVIFAPVDKQVSPGKCTTVRWDVENVSAVYYENLGVNGHGEREECIDDRAEVYTLVVILPNGAAQTYTTTVGIVPPTNTPEPTPVPVVNPTATPTWTPLPPTPTPTPNWILGVALSVNGGADQVCSAGQACEIGLLVSNTGNTVDDITLNLESGGPWPGRLCRLDGVCAQASLYISSVGPGSTAYVTFRLDVPAEAAGNEGSYDFRAVSDRSQGRVTSDILPVRVAAQ